ncbi:MAG: DNA methyltransferase, partial [Ignavibacteria bacterium]|nr:DNA methyltransferase [Ignavibacteria bacterium]
MNNQDKRKDGTKTSSFGSPGRINHDSSKFYNSRLYEGLVIDEKISSIEYEIPKELLNKHYCHSSEQMNELPDNSIHLMITSPPYNVTKEYDNNLSLEEYLVLLKNIWKETYRVLVPGGRACINIANLGRKP